MKFKIDENLPIDVAELQRQYPRTRLQDDPQEFLVYNAAMRFLKSKASMVFQARISADTTYLSDKYIFDGTTVLESSWILSEAIVLPHVTKLTPQQEYPKRFPLATLPLKLLEGLCE